MNKQKYLGSAMLIIFISALSVIPPFSTDMYLPGLPEIVKYFGTTDAILNMTLYGFFFFMALGILFLGPVSDKYGRKPILLVSLGIYTVFSVLSALSPNIVIFILFRILQGIGAGGIMVVSVALVKDCFESKVRNTVLTLTVIIGIIGPLASPILGAYIIENINWHWTLIFPAIITLACIVITLFLTEPLTNEDKFTGSIFGVLKRLPIICRNKNILLFLLASSILSIPFMSFLSVSSYIFVEGFGLSGSAYSYMLAANVIVGTIGMLVIQQIGKHIGNRRTGPIFIVLGIISGILMLSLGSLNPIACLLCFIPCGIAAIGVRPYAIGILLNQYEGDTGSISSLFNFLMALFGCIGMMIGTLPWPDYITGLGICITGAALVSAVLWIILLSIGMKLRGMGKNSGTDNP